MQIQTEKLIDLHTKKDIMIDFDGAFKKQYHVKAVNNNNNNFVRHSHKFLLPWIITEENFIVCPTFMFKLEFVYALHLNDLFAFIFTV